MMRPVVVVMQLVTLRCCELIDGGTSRCVLSLLQQAQAVAADAEASSPIQRAPSVCCNNRPFMLPFKAPVSCSSICSTLRPACPVTQRAIEVSGLHRPPRRPRAGKRWAASAGVGKGRLPSSGDLSTH